jgi:hypothetical protein
MAKVDERIQALETKLKQLKVQQTRKEARARTAAAKRSRGEELRRKILAGARSRLLGVDVRFIFGRPTLEREQPVPGNGSRRRDAWDGREVVRLLLSYWSVQFSLAICVRGASPFGRTGRSSSR